jgi:hypothetical protein
MMDSYLEKIANTVLFAVSLLPHFSVFVYVPRVSFHQTLLLARTLTGATQTLALDIYFDILAAEFSVTGACD